MGDFTLDQIADLPLDLLIGGKAVAASDGGRFDVVDPATGEVITTVADGTVDDAHGRGRRGRRGGSWLGGHRPARAGGGAPPGLRADDGAGRRARPPDLAGERQGAG